jgi:DNA polymerase-1
MVQGELFNGIKYMIVDGHNFAYRAGLVSGFSLSTSEGEDTTVLFAMLNMIRHQMDKYKPNEVCVCWDWEGSKIKEALYPEYKETRRVARAELSRTSLIDKSVFIDIGKQIRELQAILPYFGIKQVKIKGVEADDVIGLLCEQLKGVLVVSSDRDLLQLIDLGALVYYLPKDVLVTKDNFKELFGISPELFIYYKSLINDKSDNIMGLKGFGKKTSAKLVSKYGPWRNWFQTSDGIRGEILGELNKPQKEEISKEGVLEILERNYSLMKAGFLVQDLKDTVLSEFSEQTTSFNQEEIEKYFENKQFSSYLARFNGWIMPFAMMAYHQIFNAGLKKVEEFRESNK